MILNLSKENINTMPLDYFQGEIDVISSTKKMKKAYDILKSNKYIGFDSETRPSFVKGQINPVSLVQLATDNQAFLFRILEIEDLSLLNEILSDKKIVKISQSADYELKKLYKEKSLEAHNFVDLSLVAKKISCKPSSLRGMAAIFLKKRISKGAQKSNWERNKLTQKQMVYAATDAWVCRMIFFKMKDLGYINNINDFKLR